MADPGFAFGGGRISTPPQDSGSRIVVMPKMVKTHPVYPYTNKNGEILTSNLRNFQFSRSFCENFTEKCAKQYKQPASEASRNFFCHCQKTFFQCVFMILGFFSEFRGGARAPCPPWIRPWVPATLPKVPAALWSTLSLESWSGKNTSENTFLSWNNKL